MNDFILEFKLKGSSPLELKTDLCMLWNEPSAPSVPGPFYTDWNYKTKRGWELQWWEEFSTVQVLRLHTIIAFLTTIFTIFDMANASYILLKKKASFILADMVSVTSTVIGLCHIWGKLLPYVPLKKEEKKEETTRFWMGAFKKRG